MIREFVALNADVQALKNAFGRMVKWGTVHEVDKDKGYRVKLDERGGKLFLSPWRPHPETGKSSVPLKVGEPVGLVNPGGDLRQGLLLRGGYTDAYPTPNDDMTANVFADAGVRLSIKDGVLHVQSDGKVVVESPNVSLGGEGGKPVARVGDMVNVQSGSSAGLWPIVEGSSVVSAVD